MKKLSIFILAAVICFTFIGGSLDTSSVSKAAAAVVLSDQEFLPTSDYVKQIGRTYSMADSLWLAYSGTGIEFTFKGTRAELTLLGDNVAMNSAADGSYCRIGIYVNDTLVSDVLLKEQQKTITVFESDTSKDTTIKVVKLSEAGNSTFGIGKIKVTSEGSIKPTKAKAHRIEFIGDSITCGFGIDDNDVNMPFTTAKENITKTYAYKTAQTLNADYSIVAASGHGVVSGITKLGVLNTNQIIPSFYDKVGSSSGMFNGTVKVDSLKWDFKRFQPDVVVINLGTNDSSYTGFNKGRLAEFEKAYVSFLKQIRKNNSKAKIVCTYGMMGGNMFPYIEEAVKMYTKETKDKNVASMKFDAPLNSDGYGACWHPSEKTNIKAAAKLSALIKKLMKWK